MEEETSRRKHRALRCTVRYRYELAGRKCRQISPTRFDAIAYCPPLLSNLSFGLKIGGKTCARQKKITSRSVGNEAGWARKQWIQWGWGLCRSELAVCEPCGQAKGGCRSYRHSAWSTSPPVCFDISVLAGAKYLFFRLKVTFFSRNYEGI